LSNLDSVTILTSYVMALKSCAPVVLNFHCFNRNTHYWRNLHDTQICAPMFKKLWYHNEHSHKCL